MIDDQTLNPTAPIPAVAPVAPSVAAPVAPLVQHVAPVPAPVAAPAAAPVAFPNPPAPSIVSPVLPPAPVAQPVATSPVPAPVAVAPVVTAPVAQTQVAAPVATSTVDKGVYEGKSAGKYRVVVIKDKCIGAASCVAVAPKAFKLNDQQIAEVLPSINQETDENVLLAAQSCPTLAIEVYDTVTGEKVWPK